MSFAKSRTLGMIPATVHDGAREWTVSRAWPSAHDGARTATLELTAAEVGDVRGGHWSAAHGTRLEPPRSDARLAALGHVAREGTIVSHRPARRAVVRAADGGSYAKVVRPGRAGTVVTAHESAALFALAFRVAELWRDEQAEGQGVVRFAALPGRTIHALGADPRTSVTQWAAAWRAWADGWLALDRHDAVGVRGLRVHTADDEARVVREWAAHAAREIDDDTVRGIRSAAEDIAEALRRRGDRTLTLAHRDLHDKQLLWAGDGSLGLLDLDTASLADPALDLGNLRAHLHLRAMQHRWPRGFARIAAEQVDSVAAHGGVDEPGLALYEAAARFRLGCLYLFRPRWRALAERMLAEAVAQAPIVSRTPSAAARARR